MRCFIFFGVYASILCSSKNFCFLSALVNLVYSGRVFAFSVAYSNFVTINGSNLSTDTLVRRYIFVVFGRVGKFYSKGVNYDSLRIRESA